MNCERVLKLFFGPCLHLAVSFMFFSTYEEKRAYTVLISVPCCHQNTAASNLHVYMTAKSGEHNCVCLGVFFCLFVCFPCPWIQWVQVLILIHKMWRMGVKGICDNVNC